MLLEGRARYLDRPERSEDLRGALLARVDDREYLLSLRGTYMFGDVAGAEIGMMHTRRRVSADPKRFLSDDDTRLTTRVVLHLGDTVAAAFGVGWDLDDRNPYDGGGVTITAGF